MKYDTISMNLMDIVDNIKELMKNLSTNVDYIHIEDYSSNVLTLMDILDSIKIIEKEIITISNNE